MPWLAPVLFLVVFLVAGLCVLMAIRSTPRHHRLRLQLVAGCFVAMLFLWTMILISKFGAPAATGIWANALGLGMVLAGVVGALRKLRRSAKAETVKHGFSLPHPAIPPSLRWQLALVLLPVVALAAVGIVALSRDRVAVEADARLRAGDVAGELATRLDRRAPVELNGIEQFGERYGDIWAEALADPADPPHEFTAAERTLMRSMPGMQEWWMLRYASPPAELLPAATSVGLQPGPSPVLLPIKIHFDPAGLLDSPKDFPEAPIPPSWPRGLSPELSRAWDSVRSSEGEPVESAVRRDAVDHFSSIADTPALKALARFHKLKLEARSVPAATAARQFLGLATDSATEGTETESGLPLCVAAFAEARIIDPQARLDDEWFSAARALTFIHPSSLTPWVLREGSLLAQRGRSAAAESRVNELRGLWMMDERRRALARLLQARLPLSRGPLTNLWLDHDGIRWLAATQPVESAKDGRRSTRTYVRVVSAEVMGRVFYNSAIAGPTINGHEQRQPPRLPAGLGISFEIEGVPLPLPEADWVARAEDRSKRILAEAGGEFRPDEVSQKSEGPPFAWPSRPKFVVRVHLVDSAALFAAQRRQQGWFAAMILSTAGIACFGGWQARRAFRRQIELNEQKSDFVSSVSHELRAPLASMRLLAEGLASGRVEEDGKRREYAGFLVQETRRLGALVENVLDFAGIEQGRDRYELAPTDVGQLVAETVKLVGPAAAERGVRIETVPPATSPVTGFWDGRAVQRALLNLLDNALKHSPRGAVVTVRIRKLAAVSPIGPGTTPTAYISVADQGPGIPPEDHARIFERFVRRGSELRRETQGVGLGLAIVKRIAEAHRGQVTVASVPGKGATFTLELPVSPVGGDQ